MRIIKKIITLITRTVFHQRLPLLYRPLSLVGSEYTMNVLDMQQIKREPCYWVYHYGFHDLVGYRSVASRWVTGYTPVIPRIVDGFRDPVAHNRQIRI